MQKLAKFIVFLMCICTCVLSSGSVILLGSKLFFLIGAILIVINEREMYTTKYTRWITAVSIFCSLSLLWAIDPFYPSQAIRIILFNGLILFLFTQILLKYPECLQIFFMTYAYGAILRALLVISTYGTATIYGMRNNTDYNGYNSLGFIAAIGALFMLFMYKENKRILYFITAIIDILIILVSTSRKGIAYFAIAFIVLYLFKGENFLKRLKNLLILAVILVSTFFIFMKNQYLYHLIGKSVNELIGFFTGSGWDQSASGRMSRIKYGIEFFQERPFFGHGIMNYNLLYGRVDNTDLLIADNNYIDLMVGIGIFGTVIYYSIFIYVLSKFKILFDENNTKKILMYGILLAIVVCDYGSSTYIHLHVQLVLAAVFFVLCNEREGSIMRITLGRKY